MSMTVCFDQSQPQVINSNGGWCWFQDPRVMVDRDTGKVVAGTVANLRGIDGQRRDADINVTEYDPATGESVTTTIANIPTRTHLAAASDAEESHTGDDHNAPALWQRPDGRFLVVCTGHNYGRGTHHIDTSPDTFYRISSLPNDTTRWGELKVFTWPSNDPVGDGRNVVTYSNLHYLPGEGGEKGCLYNIARAAGNIWHLATSDDWGESWTYRGILTLPPSGGRAYSNGYMKFLTNGSDRIDFITTEAHPRDYNNSLYHGFIRNGKSHDSTGRVIDPDLFTLSAPRPEAFTAVFQATEVLDGQRHHAWPIELKKTADGVLNALFTVRYGTASQPDILDVGAGNADHRLMLARWDGSNWKITELAKMGHGLWNREGDYTGLAVLNPLDGRTVYVSTLIDPRNNRTLPKHEIFMGHATPDFETWAWTPVTEASTDDQLRPQLAVLSRHQAVLLWLRGRYDSQHYYSLQVMAQSIRDS